MPLASELFYNPRHPSFSRLDAPSLDLLNLNVMPEFVEVCEQAARAAGKVLLGWRGRFEVREKGPADLVTQADLESQEAVRSVVLGAFPDHAFLSEEEPNRPPPGGYRWIVDPLDGTMNYVHGLHGYCVSIALERDGEVLVGTVYEPEHDTCYVAQRGAGAFRNGQRLSVSRAQRLEEALVAVSFPPQVRRTSDEVLNFLEVLETCRGVRRLGSAALNLSYVAAGQLDAFWATETHAWDIAAGMLLVTEAGGTVTSLAGGPVDFTRPKFVAAATPELHAALRARLRPGLA